MSDAIPNASGLPAAALPRKTITEWDVFRGLLWREWLGSGWGIRAAWCVWVIGLWVLVMFWHVGFILGFGALCAILGGLALGGGEPTEGSEEFSLSLPPTRSQRYVARMSLGLATILGLTALGSLTIACDLPQALWGLVVQSGLTRPFPPCEYRFLYSLAVVVPLAVFAFTFVIASLAPTRWMVAAAGLLGPLLAGLIMLLGFLAEHLLWDEGPNGMVSIPVLLAVSAAVLGIGHAAYCRKEGITRPGGAGGLGAWWWVIIAIALVIFLLMGTFWARTARVSRGEGPHATLSQDEPRATPARQQAIRESTSTSNPSRPGRSR